MNKPWSTPPTRQGVGFNGSAWATWVGPRLSVSISWRNDASRWDYCIWDNSKTVDSIEGGWSYGPASRKAIDSIWEDVFGVAPEPDLPIISRQYLRLDTGALVEPDRDLAYWWDIDVFLESLPVFVPRGDPKKKRYTLPGPRGYCG